MDLTRQVESLRPEIERRFRELFASATFVLRKPLTDFEEQFAAYLGARHCIGVSSGTDAVMLALKALELSPGEEVITVPNSFIATASAVVHAGATPIFVDVDPLTLNMDVAQLDRAITERTRAIVPVHLYGRPADMDPILEIARARGLFVVEDAAQAHGARYRGRRVGSIGHLAAFSFYPTKNLGAFGEGGAVVTDDDQLARRVRLLRDHGGATADHHEIIGHNARLHTLQAAVLGAKLPQLDAWNARRQEHARTYAAALAGERGISTPPELGDHVHHLYVTRVRGGTERRDAVLKRLRAAGVGAGVHYPVPIHRSPAFSHLGLGPGSFPVAEKAAGEILSLPMYPELTSGELAYVCEQVARALED